MYVNPGPGFYLKFIMPRLYLRFEQAELGCWCFTEIPVLLTKYTVASFVIDFSSYMMYVLIRVIFEII